jgi:hypothetical protein
VWTSFFFLLSFCLLKQGWGGWGFEGALVVGRVEDDRDAFADAKIMVGREYFVCKVVSGNSAFGLGGLPLRRWSHSLGGSLLLTWL